MEWNYVLYPALLPVEAARDRRRDDVGIAGSIKTFCVLCSRYGGWGPGTGVGTVL